jgi:tetratricopeptide (TPR) repeat protein
MDAWAALAAGRIAEAERAFGALLARDPVHADALLGLAHAFSRRGDRLAAAGAARRAASLLPDRLDAQLQLADFLRDIGNFADAIVPLERAAALAPGVPRILARLADAYRLTARPGDAVAVASAAIASDSASVDALVALGFATLALERPDDADAVFCRALERDPANARALRGRGQVALERAAWSEADGFFDRALASAPADPDARFQRAVLDLRFGRVRAGWEGFGAIVDTEIDRARYFYSLCGVPLWDGSPLRGRRLLVSSSHGLGDHLMMARFFSRLPADGEITIESPPELLALFARSFPAFRFVLREPLQSPASMDVHIPIMNLPHALGVTDESDLLSRPYLRVDDAAVAGHRAAFAREPAGRRIGIAWHGNPKNRRERWRSAPLESWAPLAQVADLRFHALHLAVTDDERVRAPFPLACPSFADLDETAAFVGALDAVVTVDTSIVHLAGALGVPAFLANPVNSDFRWEIERTDSPWYASVEIVRQHAPGCWDDVFARIAQRLVRR